MKSRKSNCDPDSSGYTGRFAPSPSGPLHFGSLLAAVASYLDARSQRGRWLMRMEDLDPEREPPGTDKLILQQLQDFGLCWDGEVIYQSSRLSAYAEAFRQLDSRGLCYRCDCSRQRIKALGSVYDRHCRNRSLPDDSDAAIRLRTDDRKIEFEDLIQGPQSQQIAQQTGDFIIRRRDGLFAYQLAVVVDDAMQDITHVVRGWDLLESTPRQIYLQRLLGYRTPVYAHVPIITNESGQKLSKQHFAEPLDAAHRDKLLTRCLHFLGLQPGPEISRLSVAEQLRWATGRWHIQAVPKLATIPEVSLIPE
ncbi:MAG: tRNA glutamyl-Q(34) synthetase GluQRS [Pseudohongiellaceae bacterium]